MRPFTHIALTLLATLILTGLSRAAESQADMLHLVKDGQARSVIVTPQPEAMGVQRALDELQTHIQRASGVKLPVVKVDEARSLADDRVRIVIGPGEYTRSLGVDAEALKPEQYRIKTVDNHLVFVGHDVKNEYVRRSRARTTMPFSAATMWAVDRFLERQLGVRWLWPGEVGTYAPDHKTIALPDLDITARPTMVRRQLRFAPFQRGAEDLLDNAQHKSVRQAGLRWLARHEMGNRVFERHFGHSFSHWWAKYHQQHPDYFAMSPQGQRTPRRKRKRPGSRIKLCVSNEAIDRQIIAQWKDAGKPSLWNVAPNDSGGFCTCDDCRAMDEPANQDPQAIWSGQTKLTARYVKFWNRLLTKMRRIDPEVRLISFAYSAYRNPPPEGLKLHTGIILGVVPVPWQYDLWRGWEQAGAQLMLRPNWGHTGPVGPVLPLQLEGRFFKFAQDHGMTGFFFDTPMVATVNQSARYYLIARLAQRPDLSIDEVIEEYCSAFGPAAPAIRDYLTYWQNFTQQVGYSYNAGGVLSNPNPGRYIELVREHNLNESALHGSWQVIAYLYTDQVLAKGYAILDRAARMVDSAPPMIAKRIKALRDGLDHIKLMRDVLRLGYERTRPDNASAEQFRKLTEQLRTLRHDLTLRHVIYGQSLYGAESKRHVPTTPDRAEPF